MLPIAASGVGFAVLGERWYWVPVMIAKLVATVYETWHRTRRRTAV